MWSIYSSMISKIHAKFKSELRIVESLCCIILAHVGLLLQIGFSYCAVSLHYMSQTKIFWFWCLLLNLVNGRVSRKIVKCSVNEWRNKYINDYMDIWYSLLFITTGSIPGLGRSLGGGHGNPLQFSCLVNPMDRAAWQATVQRVTQSWTQLKRLSTHAHYTNHYTTFIRMGEISHEI